MAGKLCIYKLLFWFVFGDRAGFCSAHLNLYNHESKQISFLAVLVQTYLCIISIIRKM